MTAKCRFRGIPVILGTIGLVTALGQSCLAQNAGSESSSATASATVDHYSRAGLEEMEKKLAGKVDASGIASETLKTYSPDYTMLTFRDQNGKAELHQKFADFFFVIEGKATLVTGGHIVNPTNSAPGEVRGDSVQDGNAIKLSQGDIVHIPANLPHQMFVAKGTTFKYFIIKVPEGN